MGDPSHLTDTHPYLHIHPATTPLDPTPITTTLTTLHQTTTKPSPTYEILITATGTPGPTGTRHLTWHITNTTTPNNLTPLKHTLRRCLPDTYNITTTTTSHATLLTTNPTHTNTNSQTDTTQSSTHTHDTDTLTSLRTRLQAPISPPEPPTDPTVPSDWKTAALQYDGIGQRPADWQLALTPFTHFAGTPDTPATWPLTRLFDALTHGTTPTLIQLLIQPKPPWHTHYQTRKSHLATGTDLHRHRLGHWLATTLTNTTTTNPPATTNEPQHDTTTTHQPQLDEVDGVIKSSEIDRLEQLQRVDPGCSFTVNARAIAIAPTADEATTSLDPLIDVFAPLGTDYYTIHGHCYPPGTPEAADIFTALRDRSITTNPQPRRTLIPGVPNRSPAIIADADAVANFWVTGGPSLSPPARRGIHPTPREHTGIELPSREVLTRYLTSQGQTVGYPATIDQEPLDAKLAIPPAVQQLHTAVFGSSGTGKSILCQQMLLGNHTATAGADIYLDPKGDGAPDAVLQAHYATHGTFENVYYFDCAHLLPALPVLSIEPQLNAGIDRLHAVETLADHHIELLAGYMGAEKFHNAPTAVALAKALIKALFDPVYGTETVSQYDLLMAAADMHRTGDPPQVSDPHLHEQLADVTANSPDVFDNIMGAAARRLSLPLRDARLKPLFTHAATTTSDAWFDLRSHLDTNALIVIDTSSYHTEPRRLLTLTIITQLWTALKRRTHTNTTPTTGPHLDTDTDDTTSADADTDDPDAAQRASTLPESAGDNSIQGGSSGGQPQVSLFLEEAADVATSDLLQELLSQGRSFGIGVTVFMQFPEQIRDRHPDVYRELINDVGTHITGPINDPADLTKPFATAEYPPDEIARRIANLERGEWLVRPASPFATTTPGPFICHSPPLPTGHPDSDTPLTTAQTHAYTDARDALVDRLADTAAIPIDGTYTDDAANGAGAGTQRAREHGVAEAGAITLPYTSRLPEFLTVLDDPPYAIVCRQCENRYYPTSDGMHDAITCCHDFELVDRDDIPICNVDLALTPQERAASDCTDSQLRFLAAVYKAHQRGFNPAFEYDIVHDSMRRLQDYVGATTDDINALCTADLLTRDCDHPHVLYTVTPEGRNTLSVGHREGIAYGEETGDLNESSLHVMMTEAGARYLKTEYVDDPDSPATTITPYRDVDDGRLDAAACTPNGDIIAALEAERINHDHRRAIPADYDKIAACNPTDAIWIVKNTTAAHTLLAALNNPATGYPRIEKTYSDTVTPTNFTITTTGLTEIHTIQTLQTTHLTPPS